jgi:hypothetical protein
MTPQFYRLKLSTPLTPEFVTNCVSTNSSGSINLRYTLGSIREKLYGDIKVLDQMLNYTSHLTNPIIDPNIESVIGEITDTEIASKLKQSGIIDEVDKIDLTDFSEDDEETDITRFRMLANVITTEDLKDRDIKDIKEIVDVETDENLFDDFGSQLI